MQCALSLGGARFVDGLSSGAARAADAPKAMAWRTDSGSPWSPWHAAVHNGW